MRKKKWVAFLAAGLLAMGLTGCSKIDSGAMKALQSAAELTDSMPSGAMDIVSSSGESDKMTMKFSYCYDESDVMHYCVEQFDEENRRLFLEYNDGSILQQWLLGHGSTSYDKTSTNFVCYTKEMPYKYLPLLTKIPAKDAVTDLIAEPTEDGMCYRLTLDVQKISGETDTALQSRVVCYTVASDGTIIGYEEQSEYLSAAEEKSSFMLSIKASDYGKVAEITLPKIE